MKTDVLFIHHQLAFAVSIKQALERTGGYDVHPFTSVEAALEYLHSHTQDVALVDFMMPVYSGEEIVERLREVQAGITVVATPTQTEAEFARIGLQGMLNSTFTAREFIPVIERALEGRRTGELPTGQKGGLLDRVQDPTSKGDKRPPTSVIGYRSLESILDQSGAAREAQPPAKQDAPTLVEGLPAARAADELGFLADVKPPAPAEPRINTEKLADMDKFTSDEFPETGEAEEEPKGIITDSFKGITEPLPEDLFDLDEQDLIDTPSSAQAPPDAGGAPFEPLPRVTSLLPEEEFDFEAEDFPQAPTERPQAGHGVTTLLPEEAFDFENEAFAVPAEDAPVTAADDVPWSEGGYGTRPLPDAAFDDELQSPDKAAEEAGLQSLSAKLRERDLFGTRPLEPGDEDPFDLFGRTGNTDVLAVFDEVEAEAAEEAPDEADEPIDYLAELRLKPPVPAADVPDTPAPPPAPPNEDEMVAGLVALFERAAEAPEPELSFEELLAATGQERDDFADVLDEIAPGEAAERERSAFDDMIASMSTREQRPPLPTRQQQYVDVPADEDEPASQMPEFALDIDAGDDDSALVFEDEAEAGGDTPSEPAPPVLEESDASPEPASSEQLAALFAAPRAGEPPPPAPDFDAMFTTPPADEEEVEVDFEALFSSAPPADEIEFEAEDEELAAELNFEDLRPADDNDDSLAEAPDFEALFAGDEAEDEEQPDFDAMFGVPAQGPAAPLPPDVELFGGEWDAGGAVEVDEAASFEETGTVSDLMSGVGEATGGRSGMLTRLDTDLSASIQEKPSRASAETSAAALPPIDDSVTALLAEIEQQLMAAPPPATGIAHEQADDSGDTPARRILATASDAELSDSGFSVDNLLSNIEAQLPPNQAKVQPLPSWLRTPPPHSLPEAMPEAEATVAHQPESFEETVQHDSVLEIEEEPPFDWEAATFDDTTIMGEAARLEQAEATGDEETSWLAFIGPDGDDQAGETLLSGARAAEVGSDLASADAEPEPEAELEAPELQAEHIDDPYIAQLALSLTDVSLELTADAVLLTREQDIAAFAGRMSRAELLELRQVIDDDWEATASDARIRFLRLPESGKDVMLYSRRTVEDLTLSLVFDGAMPLRDIRQQGKRLTDALAAVPEIPVDVVLSVSPEEQEASAAGLPDIPRSPHAYVWLLRDPDAVLARPVAQAILNGLHQQMHEHGWRMHELRASEDHIYLLADSPDEQPPYKAVRELMRRSAQIAHVQNPALDVKLLWADAYLVVSPGRPLEQDEIQQFIQFERTL
jgi:CheY-like chemotaxis protein